MTDDHELDRTADGSAGFLVGALGGLAVGIGLGLLLAPKSGAELRRDISQSAGDLKRTANDSYQQVSGRVRDSYQKVSETVRDTVERGRAAVGKGQQILEEARRGSTGSSISSDAGIASSFGAGPDPGGAGYTG